LAAAGQLYPIRIDCEHSFAMKIQKNIVETDENLLFNFYPNSFSTFFTISDVSYNYYEKSPHGKYGPNELNICYNVNLDQRVSYYYKRSYTKLDAALANSIAIIKLVTIIMSTLNKVFNMDKVRDHLISKLYKIKSKNNFPLQKSELIQLNTQNNNNRLIISQKYNSPIRVEDKKENNKIFCNEEKANKYSITGQEISLNLFAKFLIRAFPFLYKKPMAKAYKNAVSMLINKDLEIRYILQKMIFFENYKLKIAEREKIEILDFIIISEG
jgi:hypothetical protein